jgi:hypothetical protein
MCYAAKTSLASESLTVRIVRLVVDRVQVAVVTVASSLLPALDDRFPPNPLQEAWSVVHPRYWKSDPSDADLQAKIKVLADMYGEPAGRWHTCAAVAGFPGHQMKGARCLQVTHDVCQEGVQQCYGVVGRC